MLLLDGRCTFVVVAAIWLILFCKPFVAVWRALEVLGANMRTSWCVCEGSADECLVLGEPGMHQHYAYRHTMGALWWCLEKVPVTRRD